MVEESFSVLPRIYLLRTSRVDLPNQCRSQTFPQTCACRRGILNESLSSPSWSLQSSGRQPWSSLQSGWRLLHFYLFQEMNSLDPDRGCIRQKAPCLCLSWLWWPALRIPLLRLSLTYYDCSNLVCSWTLKIILQVAPVVSLVAVF